MKREIKIGLTLLSAVLILYFWVAWMKNLHFFDEGHKNYTIIFNNVNGLLQGASVNVFGYPSGNVISIQPMQDHVEVKVRLLERVDIHTDALAEIQLKELMGGKQIELNPGRASAILPEGGKIKGYISPDLTSAFSMFGDALHQVDTARINRMMVNMEKITETMAFFAQNIHLNNVDMMVNQLSLTGEELRKSAEGINIILQEVQNKNVIDRGDSAFRAIALMLQNVEKMLESSDKMLGQSANLLNQVNGLIAKTESKTLPKTDSIMQQVIVMLDKTDKTLSTVEDIVGKLNQKETIVGKALNDPDFLEMMDSTLRNVNQTLEYVRKDRIKASVSLGKLWWKQEKQEEKKQ